MAIVETVIENIDRELESRKWSKAELARRAGMHVTTLSRIMHKHLEPSITMCESIAKAFGIPPENLLVKNS